MAADSSSAAEPKFNIFSSPDFARYQLARLGVILGAEAQSVAVAWQVYQITHSALNLGMTGLMLFLPGIFFVLPAGHAADRYNRKSIILACYAVQTVCSFALFLMAYHGTRNVHAIYAVLFCIGAGRAFSGPASAAILPSLVPKGEFVKAVTWGAAVFQIANIMGPAVGGILFTLPLERVAPRWNGAPIAYAFTLLMLCAFLILVSTIHPQREVSEKKGFSVNTMLEGLRYVFGTKILLGSISLDMFAVLLGGATSLMPIFAQDILHAGPRGLGLLRAMPALGALCMSLALTKYPLKRNAGSKMLVCVAIYGVATVVFGLSKSVPLSLIALIIIGASDNISVVVRGSILQLATPPEKRGRVSAINWLFLGTSNEFGEFESGLMAQWLGAVRAVVVGGVGSLMVTGAWAIFFPRLRRVDQLTEESLQEANRTYSAAEPIG
ncbi:MAG: MFS transporter [Acidobacteria bacterium]|nr:MFS transporter [Acidobacteriota bacterium]